MSEGNSRFFKSALQVARFRFAVGVSAVAALASIANWGAKQNDPVGSIIDDRFTFSSSSVASPVEQSPLRSFVKWFKFSESLRDAKQRLAGELRSSQATPPRPTDLTAGEIPLPRSRPVQADLNGNQYVSIKADERSFLEKLSSLLPSGLTLASLTPNDGLLTNSPSLRSMGFDELTALYDVSGRAVYLPNGLKLEAHSGFGALKDDPDHARERNVGATPPALYDLTVRERPFHGVQAIRLIPKHKESALGRDGLLVHSYMLGPEGDSNGCVSIREYDKFLAAFQRGEITKLVVVKSLQSSTETAARAALSGS